MVHHEALGSSATDRRVVLLMVMSACCLLCTSASRGEEAPPAPLPHFLWQVRQVRFVFEDGTAVQMWDHKGDGVASEKLKSPEWDAQRAPEENEPALYEKNKHIEIEASFTGPQNSSAVVTASGSYGGMKKVRLVFFDANGLSIGDKTGSAFIRFEVAEKLTDLVKTEQVAWTWYATETFPILLDPPVQMGTSTHKFFLAQGAHKRILAIHDAFNNGKDGKVFEQAAEWSVDWTPDTPKDDKEVLTELVNKIKAVSGLVYIVPDYNIQFGTDATFAERLEDLLDRDTGECGYFVALFQSLAAIQDIVTRSRFAQCTVPDKVATSPVNLDLIEDPEQPGRFGIPALAFRNAGALDYADSFRTLSREAVGRPFKTWRFGGHCIATRKDVVYDPTFTNVMDLKKDIRDYLRILVDRWGVWKSDQDENTKGVWFQARGYFFYTKTPEPTEWLVPGPGTKFGHMNISSGTSVEKADIWEFALKFPP